MQSDITTLPSRTGGRVFVKHCAEPWLTWISEGKKRYEGRVRHKEWRTVKVGDSIAFWNEERGVPTVVSALHLYDDFGAAFAAHGKELIPEGANNSAEACAVYGRIFDNAVVAKCGVVVCELTLRDHVPQGTLGVVHHTANSLSRSTNAKLCV